jgi:GNAT superfamily N-acetyltransferase
MVSATYRFSLLTRADDLSDFRCRNPVFDRYLKERAGQDMRRRVATVFLLKRSDEPAIVGYYTASSSSIALTDVPVAIQKRLPRYPMIPAVLVGRLALDHRYEAQRLGRLLLVDALDRVAMLEVAAWGVVVDAIDENAARFYERFGFIRLESHPNRLILPVETYLRAAGKGAP